MQDKEVQSYMDPEFREKAWHEMQSILDREMPVQKDRRRFIIWFWRAAGILLLVTAGIVFWPENTARHEMATTEAKNLVHENNSIDKLDTDDKTAKTIVENIASKNQAISTKTKSDNSPKSRNQNSDVISAKLPTKESALALNPIPNDYPQLTTLKEESVPTIGVLPEEEITLSAISKRQDLVQSIRTLGFQISDYSKESLSFGDTPVRIPRGSKPKKVDFLIYANGQSESFLALTGYEAGAAVHKRLGKSKWGLSVGSGFQSEIRELDFETESYLNLATVDASFPNFQVSVSPEIGVSNGFTENTDAPVNNPSLSDYEYLAAANAAASKLNVKLNYLAFPVSATYQLTPRIGILAGVTPSVYLSGSVTLQDNYAKLDANFADDEYSPIVGGNNSISSSSSGETHPLENNRFFYYTSKPLAPAAINRMKFPVHVGLNYQLTKHLGITMNYQYTPFNITDKPYIRTSSQRIRLGGFWKF
ncbi:MAG: hypothetical protein DWQ02_17560 [Bacteroidetes bacterium]|nr:MAG: hypothetical protein DWQ02_17560 [Bacteroidota bacterium]